jgi:hypothetical protein
MAKLTLSDLSTLTNDSSAVTAINSNSALIETALENTLSRDGTSPNAMNANLDMNSNRILNLPTPTNDTDVVTKLYGDENYGGAIVTAAEGFADDAEASALASAASAVNSASSASDASNSADAAAISETNADASADAAAVSAATAATAAQNTFTRYEYTVSGGDTSVTGSDDNGNTLSYVPGAVLVLMNGFLLDTSDYTATTSTSITGLAAMTAGDIVSVIAFGTFVFVSDDHFQKSLNGSDIVDASVFRTNIGLAIGTHVQAYDADLAAIAALAKTDGNIIVGDGSAWVAESGATARTSLGLGTAAVSNTGDFDAAGSAAAAQAASQPLDADLTAIAALDATAGLLAKTAANTYARRTVTGTANEVSVADGSGASGNPTLSLPSALTFTGKTVTGGTFSGVTLSGTTTLPGSGAISIGGSVGVGVSPTFPGHFYGATGIKSQKTNAAGISVFQGAATSTAENMVVWRDGDGNDCGIVSINASANTTAYGTSSDYRLKGIIGPADTQEAWDALAALPVHRGTYKADPGQAEYLFFVAHEVAERAPTLHAVIGKKDATDIDGHPVYQSIDYGRMTPLLAAALKNAQERIINLENRLTLLENI